MIIPISAIGRENVCETTNLKCSTEIDVHSYKNSISHPEKVFFFQLVRLCVLLSMGTMEGKNIFFSSTIVYIPLKITFLSDKQATALNCSSSLSELTYSFLSQYILPYFEKILCGKTVLMIQVISYSKIL